MFLFDNVLTLVCAWTGEKEVTNILSDERRKREKRTGKENTHAQQDGRREWEKKIENLFISWSQFNVKWKTITQWVFLVTDLLPSMCLNQIENLFYDFVRSEFNAFGTYSDYIYSDFTLAEMGHHMKWKTENVCRIDVLVLFFLWMLKVNGIRMRLSNWTFQFDVYGNCIFRFWLHSRCW